MSNGHVMGYALRPMREADIPQASQIDRDAFPENLSVPSFKHELRNNKLAHYLVAWDTVMTYEEWRREAGLPAPREERPASRGRLATAVRRVLRVDDRPAPPDTEEFLVGYLGMWNVVDEGHIISVGVRSSHRGNGIGELLLLGSIELSMALGCRQMTLECRVSNDVAQNLYKKYGFRIVGRRKGYYADNHEDAYVMTTEQIDTPDYSDLLSGLRARHSERWGVSVRYLDDDGD